MEVWTQGIFLTVFGMGVVFLCLVALSLIIGGVDRLFRKSPLKRTPLSSKGPPQEKAFLPGEDLSPVISAAVAAYLKAKGDEVFRVPVRRDSFSRWVADGRQIAISRRDSL